MTLPSPRINPAGAPALRRGRGSRREAPDAESSSVIFPFRMKRTRLSRGRSLAKLLTRLDGLSREDRSLVEGLRSLRTSRRRVAVVHFSSRESALFPAGWPRASARRPYAKLPYYDDRSVTPFPRRSSETLVPNGTRGLRAPQVSRRARDHRRESDRDGR